MIYKNYFQWVNQTLISSLPFYKFILSKYYLAFLIYSFLATALYYPELKASQLMIVDTKFTIIRFFFHAVIIAFLLAAFTRIAQCYQLKKPVDTYQVIKMFREKSIQIVLSTLLYVCIIIFFSKVFVLPGIYLGISCIFYLPFILLQHNKIFEALKKSFYLVQGNWCKTFLLAFIVFILPGMLLGQLLPKGSILPLFVNLLFLLLLTPFAISVWWNWHNMLVERQSLKK